MKWHPHTEQPSSTNPVTAIIAVPDEEDPRERFLLGIHLWRPDHGGWVSEETFKPVKGPHWWMLERELLAALPAECQQPA
jgi:hypothetical protein